MYRAAADELFYTTYSIDTDADPGGTNVPLETACPRVPTDRRITGEAVFKKMPTL